MTDDFEQTDERPAAPMPGVGPADTARGERRCRFLVAGHSASFAPDGMRIAALMAVSAVVGGCGTLFMVSLRAPLPETADEGRRSWADSLSITGRSPTKVAGFTSAGVVVPLVAGAADGLTEVSCASPPQTLPADLCGHAFGFSTTVENLRAGAGVIMLAMAFLVRVTGTPVLRHRPLASFPRDREGRVR